MHQINAVKDAMEWAYMRASYHKQLPVHGADWNVVYKWGTDLRGRSNKS
jgi:hypothetical protein